MYQQESGAEADVPTEEGGGGGQTNIEGNKGNYSPGVSAVTYIFSRTE